MKEKLKKIYDNKIFKIVRKIISIVLTILLVLIFLVIVVQKVSNNQVNFGGFGVYTIATGSMEPEYRVKDLLLASKVDPKDINIGDDVVYLGKEESLSGKIIIHRVIYKAEENGRIKFMTQGIANSLSDPEIDESQVMGVVQHKLYILSFCSHAINNTYGLILLVIIPFIVFVFMEGKHLIDDAYKE